MANDFEKRFLIKALAVIGFMFVVLILLTILGFGIVGLARTLPSFKTKTASLTNIFSGVFVLKEEPGPAPPAASSSPEKPPMAPEPEIPKKNSPPNPSKPLVVKPGQEKTNLYSPPPAPSGLDLALKIIDRGIINETTREFTSTSTVLAGERAATVFEVINIGGTGSGNWQFKTSLPVPEPENNFISEIQAGLKPLERVRFTIGFGELKDRRENTATFSLIINDGPADVNLTNNTASTTLIRGY